LPGRTGEKKVDCWDSRKVLGHAGTESERGKEKAQKTLEADHHGGLNKSGLKEEG